ncbi:MAG: hypothetical protein ABI780_15095, partial [Ardenticatenales bacterium]
MRANKWITVLFLAAAPLTLAACGSSSDGNITGSAVDDGGAVQPADPAKPGDPGQPVDPSKPGGNVPSQPGSPNDPAPVASGGTTLESFVASLPPMQRVDLYDMDKACKDSAVCQEQLTTFENYLRNRVCPTESGCTDTVGMILYKTRTASQVRSGSYPPSLPAAKVVVDVLKTALEDGSSAVGDEPVAKVADYADTLQTVADQLKAQAGTSVDQKAIQTMIVAADPVKGDEATRALVAAMNEVHSSDVSVTKTVDVLGKGGQVDAVEASAAIEAVVADSGAAKGSDLPVKGAAADMIRTVADTLAKEAGTQVSWETVAAALGPDAATAIKDAIDSGAIPAVANPLADLIQGGTA